MRKKKYKYYILNLKVEDKQIFKLVNRVLRINGSEGKFKRRLKYDYNNVELPRELYLNVISTPHFGVKLNKSTILLILINPLEISKTLSLVHTDKKTPLPQYLQKYRMFGGCYYERYLSALVSQLENYEQFRKTTQKVYVLDPEGRFNRHYKTANFHGQSTRINLFLDKLMEARNTIKNIHRLMKRNVHKDDTYDSKYNKFITLDRNELIYSFNWSKDFRRNSIDAEEIIYGLEKKAVNTIMNLFTTGDKINHLDYMDVVNSCRVLYTTSTYKLVPF